MPDIRPEPLTQLGFELSRQEIIDRANDIRVLNGLLPIVDNHASNPHLILLESIALFTELMGKAIDNRKLASTVVTARTLQDAIIAAESTGYDWRSATPSVAILNLDFGAGWPQDITIPDGHVWLSDPNYIQDGDLFIASGTLSITANIKQTTRVTEQFVSNGSALQKFDLQSAGVVKASFGGFVSVDVDAVAWSIVDDLFPSTATDLHVVFRAIYDSTAFIKFGDGINGSVPVGPPTPAVIDVVYEVTDGFSGRISNGTIVDTVDAILDVLANPVTVTITQPVGSSGGQDIESIGSIKYNGPRAVNARSLSITRDDFVVNALSVAGVERAVALTWNDDESIPPNQTRVLVAQEPDTDGETVVFEDEHTSSAVSASKWTQVSGVWDQLTVSGWLVSPDIAGDIRIASVLPVSPYEVRATVESDIAVDEGSSFDIRIYDAATPTDYIGCRIWQQTPGTFINTRVYKYIGGVEFASTSQSAAGDLAVGGGGVAVVLSLKLGELKVSIDGADGATNLLGGPPDIPLEFYADTIVGLHGDLRTTETKVVALADFPTPNDALITDVQTHFDDNVPTLVTHTVIAGPVKIRPLSFDIDILSIVAGFDIPTVESNVTTALTDLLSVTRRDETGAFVNNPGDEIYMSELLRTIEDAAGVRGVTLYYPVGSVVQPAGDELLVLGEVKFR